MTGSCRATEGWSSPGNQSAVSRLRRSIDSYVDNVAALLRLLPLLPAEANMDALLDVAKQQLKQEADYALEAEHIARFRGLLGHEADWLLPDVVDELTTSDVLCMSFVPGDPVESLAGAPQALRDHVATRLIDLLLREFMQFGMVQTDPDFANYRFTRNPVASGCLISVPPASIQPSAWARCGD